MKIFVIGGTRFIGPRIVARLVAEGCAVTVFHRGKTESDLPASVAHVHGDKSQLEQLRSEIKRARPDLVLHMCARTREDAETLIQSVRGIVPRVVVPSSIDVYRAYGRLHKTEPGPVDPTPLTEDSPLREKLSIHGESYEKKSVEQVVMNDSETIGTILRYPAVWGPGDYRMYEFTRRMLDERPAIFIDEGYARWPWTHGYVDDVAAATVLAVLRPEAAGKIYNCGEPQSPPQIERVQHIAKLAGWNGKVIALPIEAIPAHLREPLAWEQDWICDTSRIRSELGFREAISGDDAIRAMLEWHRKNPKTVDPKEFDYAIEDAVLAALGAN